MKCCQQLVLVALLARFSHGLVHAPAATAQSQHADEEATVSADSLDAVQLLLLNEEEAGLGSRPVKLSASGDVLVEHAAEAVVAKRELADAEERVAKALERQLNAKRELAKLQSGSGQPLLAMLPPSHETEPEAMPAKVSKKSAAAAAKAVQATPAHATQKAIAQHVLARIVPVVRASKASAASHQAKSWDAIYAESVTQEPTRPASVHAEKKLAAKPAPAHIVPVMHAKVSASHSASPQQASVSPHRAQAVQAKPLHAAADKASIEPVSANANYKNLAKLIPARIVPSVHSSKETAASHGASAELAASAKRSVVKESAVPTQKEGVAKPTAAHTMHAVEASKDAVASEDGDEYPYEKASEDEGEQESEDQPTEMPAPQVATPDADDVDANPYSLEPHLANPLGESKEKPSPAASLPPKADKLPAAPMVTKAIINRAAGGLPVTPVATKVVAKAVPKPLKKRALPPTAPSAEKATTKTSLKSSRPGLPDVLTARTAALAAHPKPAAPTAQKAVTKPAPAHVLSARKQAAVTKPPRTHLAEMKRLKKLLAEKAKATTPAPAHAPAAQKQVAGDSDRPLRAAVGVPQAVVTTPPLTHMAAAVAKAPLTHMAALRAAMGKAHAREAEAKKRAQRQSQIDAVKLLRRLDDESDDKSKELYDALHIMFVHGGSQRVEAARNMLSKARSSGVQVIDDWLNAQEE